MLITFEGIDGCGKSTQIDLLVTWLTKQNLTFSLFREPGGTELSETIREMLLNGRNMDPVTELLLFSAARSQLVSEKVAPLLKRDEIVILDRFFDSTVAYQGFGRQSASIEQIEMLNHLAAHQIRPDLTFYLRISPLEAGKRTASRPKDRVESAGKKFFDRVAKGFDQISTNSKRFHTLDATEKSEKIHRRIIQIMGKAL